MKKVGQNLRPGDRVDVEIVELLRDGMMICSLDGRLFQVKNEGLENPRPGQRVRLVVEAANPLRFRLRAGPGLDRRA